MPNPVKQNHSFSQRLKIAAVSALAFLVTTACSFLGIRATPGPTFYKSTTPTHAPTPFVMCYEMVLPATETPFPMCYSPLLTPTPPDSPPGTPTPTPEARRSLQERLLARGRFPASVARELGE